MNPLWILLGILAGFLALSLGWRWASRIWSLPCPSVTAWMLDNPLAARRTRTTLDRLGLRPGQRILEIGPGPGRLLIPAAQRLLPGGEAVGIDIQPGMIERLKARADRAAALLQCHRALKPGGVLSITEIFGDPHYQSRWTVRNLTERAGFRLQAMQGRWWFYTASFIKP